MQKTESKTNQLEKRYFILCRKVTGRNVLAIGVLTSILRGKITQITLITLNFPLNHGKVFKGFGIPGKTAFQGL